MLIDQLVVPDHCALFGFVGDLLLLATLFSRIVPHTIITLNLERL